MFGSRYIRDSEKRELTRNSEVDFCLEAASGYYDIFEIKRPKHNVLIEDPSHNGYKPSAKLSEATSQIETYIKEIEEERSDILRHEKIDMLKPRGYIVIGNSLSEEKKEYLRTHNSFMNRIRVLTYSDLIGIAERTIEIQKIESN